ncbi:putative DnaJ domain, Chaperone J-domain superfamily [Helianthus annuus]|nr:putative DnaJ domain, Chaperone J-domain superfamily [Helianthus annuus]KAJ0554931.1 putative DnaJ domain, Chaperone J-domain superfamily [Helianthus annuus]
MFYKGKMNQNVPQGSYQNDSEKLEEVLEQKDVQNVESDKGGEEVLELFENAKIHDEEGTCEMFCDDFEMTQEDNITDESKEETLDESFDQEFNVKSAGDDKVSEETDNIDGIYVESNIVDMYDNIVETTQDVTEDKESTEEAVASEVCEKTSMDQNESDEDEYEVKSEVNDARCVKTDMDESNKQKNIIDNLAAENDGNANEIKDSLESRYRDKEDETEEPGPSNASGQDHFRRIYEEAAAKERERVRNRSVVERAISEARERAYAEARERAERQRADVKKAIEEARQIKMAEAGEKAAKASVASRSAQSKRRAERATVERATSEACQRALGKAISQKTVSDSNSFKSALRTKAKLEKQNRIIERAAKTIAEKEKRDRLAQKEKEQAERNHLAESLDAEIKRWSNGKEGNLRALLSTLQYILGPESGWQPVSLTHMNTTSDVKKAYRKATLCVHPDKLQQWGASIQHKYMCEKVFDLLKAAWKRFNSEER